MLLIQSQQRAVSIRSRVYGEKDDRTTKTYEKRKDLQRAGGDYPSAIQSKQGELSTTSKPTGEEHPETADSSADKSYRM